MTDLERELVEMGRYLSFAPTPRVSPRVQQRLREPAPPRPRWRSRPALALAGVVLLAVALWASPARATAESWGGVPGVIVRFISELPPGSLQQRLDLGQPMSMKDAQGRVRFRLLAPSLLGNPDKVCYREPPAGGAVTLVYAPRAGLPATRETGVGMLLMEFSGRLSRDYFEKGLGPGTHLSLVAVNGATGYWIEGAHTFAYLEPDGRSVQERIRLAGNTLLWEQGGLTIRIESALSLKDALRVAASLR